MKRAAGLTVCAAIIALTAIYAITCHDLEFAAPMLLVAIVFANRAGRVWQADRPGVSVLDSNRGHG